MCDIDLLVGTRHLLLINYTNWVGVTGSTLLLYESCSVLCGGRKVSQDTDTYGIVHKHI